MKSPAGSGTRVMTEPTTIRSDRDLQDAVIHYLADAPRRRAGTGALPMSSQQADRAERFARFLARRYYRDRLARSFRHSRRFAPPAEGLVDTPAFDGFLNDCVLGSAAAAEQVGDLAMGCLHAVNSPGPWWGELLEYERLFFLQVATSESAIPAEILRAGPSARCHSFSWNLPEILLRLKSGAAVTEELRQGVTLLFSRTPSGRIYVVEVDESTAAVFHAARAGAGPVQIAKTSFLPATVVRHTLAALAQIGALVTSSQA